MNNRLFLSKLVLILFLLNITAVAAQPNPKPLYSKQVFFEFNKWEIRPEDEKTLLTVVKAIKAQKEPYYINLTGHTDNVDNNKYNYELGLKRAREVAAYLIKRGADSTKIYLFSKGEELGKTDNSTDSLRMLNRRVEIQLFKQDGVSGNSLTEKTVTTDTASSTIKVVMVDSATGVTIRGQLLVVNKKIATSRVLMDTSTFSTPIKSGDDYEISFSAKGYRTRIITYSFSTDFIKQHKNTIQVYIVKLQKAKVKSKKSFEKIYFYGNEARFLPSSDPELKRLLAWSKSAGVSAIEIVGHVNYPYQYNQNDTGMMQHNFKLSYDRARAVYDYLVENGVPAHVITYKGVGNTEMKFPMTYEESEMQQNRRVEVLILEEQKN
jgi:outer membrane protein OmpA-like peptidoglycan-associated protein